MRLAALWREIVRDILSGTSKLVWFALVTAVLLSGLCTAELLSARAYLAAAEEFQAAGASTLTITAPGRVDAAACDALSSVPGIAASGAISVQQSKLTAAALPSAPMMHYVASPGFAAVLSAGDTSAGGVLASSEVVKTLGLRVGDTIELSDSASRVSGSYDYPSDGRRAGLGWAVIEVSDKAIFDECWITAWPITADVRSSLLLVLSGTQSAGTSDPPQIAQLNASLGQTFTGSTQFEQRITRLSAIVAAGICFMTGWFSVRIRRLQFASNLHAGLRRLDFVALVLVETLGWVLPAAIMATATVAVIAGNSFVVADTAALRALGALIIMSGAVAAVAGAVASQFAIREKHLFFYFKER